jgi:hypothetical protein
MQEQLIKYFERQERYMDHGQDKKVFLDHCFGALDFAMQLTNDIDKEDELIELWHEWRPRLEEKVYGKMC